MTAQTICQIITFLGALIAALGVLGSYHYGQKEQSEKELLSDVKQRQRDQEAEIKQEGLRKQIIELSEANTRMEQSANLMHSKMDLLIKTAQRTNEVWSEVEMNNVPPGHANYLFLLFKSNKGRIHGKVRIKGTSESYSFSSVTNDKHPVAVHNLWDPTQGHYKIPTVLEYLISEKTDPTAELSIYTQGWMVDGERDPH